MLPSNLLDRTPRNCDGCGCECQETILHLRRVYIYDRELHLCELCTLIEAQSGNDYTDGPERDAQEQFEDALVTGVL